MSFEKLVEGFRSFQSDYFAGADTELFKKLVMDGQAPEALVIACSDSRIDPGIITRAEPGDLFSVRNVAALVPPYKPDGKEHGTSAAVEYAVASLNVKSIIVMGHALCGGIRALAESSDDLVHQTDFVSSWISVASQARDLVREAHPGATVDEQAPILEQAAILVSMKNLMTFPIVRDAVAEGRLTIHGWYFDIPNGRLLSFDPNEVKFKDILEGQPQPAITMAECGREATTLSLFQFLNVTRADKEAEKETAENDVLEVVKA